MRNKTIHKKQELKKARVIAKPSLGKEHGVDEYTHIFNIGTHSGLSWAEICEVLKGNVETTRKQGDFIFVNIKVLKLTEEQLIRNFYRLGGSIKLMRIMSWTEFGKVLGLEREVVKILQKEEFNSKSVAINIYGNLQYPINKFKLELVDEFKEKTQTRLKLLGKISDAYVNSATTSKVLRKEGIELNIMSLDSRAQNIMITKTLAIQDINLWSKLDYKKPKRDMKIGMLPSKLARIMLNLASIPRAAGSFWDPFCGLGTLLMQGQLLGMFSYGSDINNDALQMAHDNILWLRERNFVKKLKYRIFTHDIRQNPKSNKILRDIAGHGRFNAVVTEPFLGKPRSRPFSTKRQVMAEWTKIKPLYKAFLRNASELINAGGRMVFVVPRFKYEKVKIYAPEIEINRKRWNVIKFKTGDLTWMYKDSIVSRNIVVIEKI